MSIQIDVKPEVEAELARRAAVRGCKTEAYAASVLEEAMEIPQRMGQLSAEQVQMLLGELSQFSDRIPLLPDEAFTREGLYSDHD